MTVDHLPTAPSSEDSLLTMAGQPRKKHMLEGLEVRTRATFSDDPTVTHLDYIDDWQSSGKTLKALAEELSTPELLVTSEMITRYLNATFGAAEVETRLTRARARGAHRLSDEALSIADAVKAKDDVPAARLRVATRQWTAEKWNREEYGPQNAPNVTISLTALHLDALRAVNREAIGLRQDGREVASETRPVTSIGGHAQRAIPQSVEPQPVADSEGRERGQSESSDYVN